MVNSSEAIGQTTTRGKRPHSKILVDGGDPQETARIKQLIGFVDGQTTNPSLIAKNPEIRDLVESGHQLTEEEEAAEYRKIVQAVSPLVGDAGVSIEVGHPTPNRCTGEKAVTDAPNEKCSYLRFFFPTNFSSR